MVDRDELSHDVLNQLAYRFNGRTAQPLGPTPSPRMRRADIEVPNTSVDVDSWESQACYPPEYLLSVSDGTSTSYRRITKATFVPARHVCLAVKLLMLFALTHDFQPC